ncbi:MAG: hypothetical protein QGH73_07815 [Rhodospirillales bacterium]|jgi:phenylacetate-CoA ligase|nr:hypothetical protein [Rhodospirillales bacterium]MDP6645930.1 hypothetical protein [Rhodospirillales bacterium]MDP6841569.1 hypothetical protein [Rhodospirillales bacterium]
MNEQRQFWNEEVETRSEDMVQAIQLQKIQKQLKRVYESTPYYRDRMERAGAAPEDIKSWDDFRNLPIFLSTDEYKDQQERSHQEDGHPFGKILGLPLDQVLAVSSTSGATGTPTICAYTAKDIETTNEVLARAYWRIGIRPGDTVLHGFGLSMWVAGIPFVRALEAMGVRAYPVGAESGSERFFTFARLARPTTLLCTPSFAEYLIEKAPEAAGMEVAELGVKKIMCAGEPGVGLAAVRAKIETAWGARLYDFAGGPWGISSVSCEHQDYQGMHLMSEDYCIAYDIVDPDTKQPIAITDGAIGTVVTTAFDWQAAPPIKFANNDLIQISTEPCPCGLPGKRKKILGRIDDLLIVKGVNVYPAAVRDLINGFVPGVTGQIRIVLTTAPPRVSAPLHIKIERGYELSENGAEELGRKIEKSIQDRLSFSPRLEFVEPGSLSRSVLKGKLIEKDY